MVDFDKRYFMKDGRGFVIRFFDCQDSRDLADLRSINESEGVQRWMDNVKNQSFDNYAKWMDEKGEDGSFLYAIADPKDMPGSERRVHAFVYVYPSAIIKGMLEMSYAKRPGSPAGLVALAIEPVCEMVREYLLRKKPALISGMKIIVEIERGNVASIKTAEKAGFKFFRDYDSKDDALWIRELVGESKKLTRVRQLNPSYCAPATLSILLSHFGLETDQETLVSAVSDREYVLRRGMSIEMMAKAVGLLFPQMSFWVKRDAGIEDIEKMVREYNYPVGVNWQGVFNSDCFEDYPEGDYEDVDNQDGRCKGDAGHYSVVVDVDRANDFVRMMDPYGSYHLKDRYFKILEFLNRWWDDRMDRLADGSKQYVFEKRLMFAVVPKNVDVPLGLGMIELG